MPRRVEGEWTRQDEVDWEWARARFQRRCELREHLWMFRVERSDMVLGRMMGCRDDEGNFKRFPRQWVDTLYNKAPSRVEVESSLRRLHACGARERAKQLLATALPEATATALRRVGREQLAATGEEMELALKEQEAPFPHLLEDGRTLPSNTLQKLQECFGRWEVHRVRGDSAGPITALCVQAVDGDGLRYGPLVCHAIASTTGEQREVNAATVRVRLA